MQPRSFLKIGQTLQSIRYRSDGESCIAFEGCVHPNANTKCASKALFGSLCLQQELDGNRRILCALGVVEKVHEHRVADDHAHRGLTWSNAKHYVAGNCVVGMHRAVSTGVHSICSVCLSLVQVVDKRRNLLNHAGQCVILGQLHNVFRKQLVLVRANFAADFALFRQARHHIGARHFFIGIHRAHVCACVDALQLAIVVLRQKFAEAFRNLCYAGWHHVYIPSPIKQLFFQTQTLSPKTHTIRGECAAYSRFRDFVTHTALPHTHSSFRDGCRLCKYFAGRRTSSVVRSMIWGKFVGLRWSLVEVRAHTGIVIKIYSF